MIYKAGHPPAGKSGAALPATWPPILADGLFPRVLALSVALTEIIGGGLVLVGWVTRLASFGLACVMLGAIWLDQIGPQWQTGALVLGFLPPYDPFDIKAWTPLLWQFALVCGSLSLLAGGSGRLAIDWAFGSGAAPVAKPTPVGQSAAKAPKGAA